MRSGPRRLSADLGYCVRWDFVPRLSSAHQCQMRIGELELLERPQNRPLLEKSQALHSLPLPINTGLFLEPAVSVSCTFYKSACLFPRSACSPTRNFCANTTGGQPLGLDWAGVCAQNVHEGTTATPVLGAPGARSPRSQHRFLIMVIN